MVDFYIKKVATIEKQLELVKIGYREEVLKISSLMARTSRKESDDLMQQINEYADAVMALEESLKDAKDSLNKSKETKNIEKEVNYENNK